MVRPQMRIHDIRFRVESLSRPQLRINDCFVEFFAVHTELWDGTIADTRQIQYRNFTGLSKTENLRLIPEYYEN